MARACWSTDSPLVSSVPFITLILPHLSSPITIRTLLGLCILRDFVNVTKQDLPPMCATLGMSVLAGWHEKAQMDCHL